MNHDALAQDLASHLDNDRRMVWQDLQLGPAPSPRPDVYTLEKSYQNPRPRAYEVKVSVPDFRSDVTEGKWQRYLGFAQAVTFAAPHGLLSKQDIPKGCGFMVRSERGWSTVRKPTLQVCEIPTEVLVKLLIESEHRRRMKQITEDHRRILVNRGVRRDLGDEVANLLINKEDARLRMEYELEVSKRAIERARKKAEDISRKNQDLRRETVDCLFAELGFPTEQERTTGWIRNDVRRRVARLDRDEEVARLRKALRDIEGAFRKATNPFLDADKAA